MANSNTLRTVIKRGHGTEERPLNRVVWARDTRADSEVLVAEGDTKPSNLEVGYDRYYDQGYFQLEIEKLWKKTWLYAAREEDMPNVGDRVPFDVGPLSFFLVRSGPDEFKAFYNACLHRGTALCVEPESADTIRCPFHGWEWNNDGSLKRIPSHWDFAGLDRVSGQLREVKLGRWGGFLYINADPDSAPLTEALGVMAEHFTEFAPQNRYTAARFRKLVRANWKITQEAFQEAYHLSTTHPEAVPFAADTQSQYDIWSSAHGQVGRLASPNAMPSTNAAPEATQLGAAQMFLQVLRDWHFPDAVLPQLDPSGDLRAQTAQWQREAMTRAYGFRPELPDALMLDTVLYFMFPQSGYWLSESIPFSYSFTPHKTDPGLSYFEVRMLLPKPQGKPCPPAAPLIEIGADESIAAKSTGFGFLSFVFDQDMSNLSRVQKGVQAADPACHHSILGTYQETIIQHWNEVLDRYHNA